MAAELLQNLLRRRSRTVLTLLGVALGIMALTMLGALAERFRLIIEGSSNLWSERITVLPGEGLQAGGLILPDQVERIGALPGVERVRLSVTLPYKGALGTLPGFAPQVNGVESDVLAALPLQAGRQVLPDESGSVMAGAAIADREGWRLGDTVWIEGEPFRLVGLLRPTLSVVDDWLYMPVEDARRLLLQRTPWLRTLSMSLSTAEGQTLLERLATTIEVLPAPEMDIERLASIIQKEFPELTALSPAMVERIMTDQLKLVRGLVLASSLIGLLVGGISILNTMLMSVTERRTELAIKRAVGATARHILIEVLAESAIIGLFGGLLGVGAGALLSTLFNRAGTGSYRELFYVTGRLTFFALLFGVAMGMLAGLLPAWRAARENPVDGLRYE